MTRFNFVESTFMVPYTREVADYCDLFSCGDRDLDEFFSHDVFLYEEELLGKTYCWINKDNQHEIVAIATLSYDGIKTYNLDIPSRNAFQRRIPQQKRHRSYPVVFRIDFQYGCRAIQAPYNRGAGWLARDFHA